MITFPKKSLRYLLVTGLFMMLAMARSKATWSIIVIDPKTNKIGITGASCTFSVYGIGTVIPGKGAIIVQAMSNPLARLKGAQMILANASPNEILEVLKDPMYDPEEQQYAIITVKQINNAATYTGKDAPAHKGALTGKGISVQGNTLASPDEVKSIFDAALSAQKENLLIEEILMIALEAGAKLGGDKRCGERKASSAFLTVFNENDEAKKPYLNLVIYDADSSINAVVALRNKLNKWKSTKKED